ncbi:MAG: Ig-like domain-containing protein [Deltaproteobacteria bacterium]|nr:Ig-like domain-containing protein [Deltaproteobacteria bacterium]
MMRAIAIASCFGGLIGCASEPGVDLPPTLEITSPQRGTTVQGDTVEVSGVVTDDNDPRKVKVVINGSEVVPAKDGTFTATIPVTAGISILETHATDGGANDVRDVRAVLSGNLEASNGMKAAPVGAKVGPAAFMKLGQAFGSTIKGMDFTALAQTMNPVYDNSGCLGAKIDITSLTITNAGVALVPKTNALDTAVTLDNVVVKLRANFKVACIGGSTTITVKSSKAHIDGDLGVAVSAGKLTTSLGAAAVTLDGFTVDVGGVPGAIESLLKGEARKAAEKALTKAVQDRVPPMANQALAGLTAKPFNANLLGHATKITVAPAQVNLSADGLFFAVDSKVLVTGGEGGMYAATPSPMSASLMQSGGVGVAIADDLVNQLFSGLWAAGAIDQTVEIDSKLAVLGALLDDDAKSLGISLALPPTVTGEGAELALSIGDMMISVKDAGGAEIQKIALSVKTTLEAQPTQTGALTLTLGQPELYAQVLASSDVVDRPMTDEQFEGIIGGAWGLVGGMAGTALETLSLPSVGGMELGSPSIEGRSGYVFADLSVN